MSEISNNAYLSSLTATSQQQSSTSETEEDKNLGQTAFLELMIAQLENQSPLDPQDNSEFVAQLAQFSSVEGLDRLNNNFDNFAASFISNQSLQAASLVGSSVSVPTDTAVLYENNVVSGTIQLPSSSGDVALNIYDAQGALVEEIDLGDRTAGDIIFRWDGNRIELDGELIEHQAQVPQTSGEYRFEVIANQEGEPVQLDTLLSANVNSVSVDSNNELILNLAGAGSVKLSDIKQFN